MLSQSREITLEIIESNPDKPWDYFYLSRNPNLTLDYVLQHPHLPWNWICLSANKNVTMELVKKSQIYHGVLVVYPVIPT